MKLSKITSPDLIKIGVRSQTKTELLLELLDLLVAKGQVHDREKVLKALLVRESQQSTGLESGIAVPHAKTDAVSILQLAVGVSKDGMDFDSLDSKPSRLFFLMLAPPGASGPHIEALSEIARLCSNDEALSMMMNAKTPFAMYEIIKGEMG